MHYYNCSHYMNRSQLIGFVTGIGIDDTFVMLAAWRRTPVTMDVPERLARTLSDAAVSITITSVTDIVSFCIGKFSPFPAIQIFCLYSGKYYNTKLTPRENVRISCIYLVVQLHSHFAHLIRPIVECLQDH